jgi:glycosyltransferase involved in cell wall biosynthesis
VDCISHLFQQAASQGRSFFGKFVTRFELLRTRRAEAELVCRFDHVLVTSSVDRDALLELATNGKQPSPISVLPNGVDLDYFHPNCDVQRDAATVVFSGKMSYHANVAMVKYLVAEIMPHVWRALPETHLFIVGKEPPSDIRNLGKDPRITVTGTVGDIRPFLWRATVSIVPLLYGAGIQNKILEAMATATPVVTTSRALPALQVQPGRDLWVADDASGFAEGITRLIENRDLSRAIGDSGLAHVRQNHDWRYLACQLTDIYQHTLDRHEVRI